MSVDLLHLYHHPDDPPSTLRVREEEADEDVSFFDEHEVVTEEGEEG